MTERRGEALPVAVEHAQRWLDSLDDRPVPPQAQVEEVVERLGTALPDGPQDAAAVIEHLATACEPGLTAMPSGRFYGMVIGGSHPAALAADWLVSAWDQNAGAGPAHPRRHRHRAGRERVAARPARAARGERGRVRHRRHDGQLHRPGGRPRRGAAAASGGTSRPRVSSASPGVRVLVGEERHDTVDLALRYLGLGAPEPVRADDQGRLDARRPRRRRSDGSTARPSSASRRATCTRARYDPFAEAIEVAHRHGAWVHVDGAFGLFAAAAPAYRHLTEGVAGADSWATDAHKTLNVPYDCGIAIVRDPAAVEAAMGMHGDYLIQDEAGDPFEKVPELSRRARSVPVWAVLAALGRGGVADLVERMAGHAATFAERDRGDPGRRGAQRRGLHPGLRELRRRRPHARRSWTGCWPTARPG